MKLFLLLSILLIFGCTNKPSDANYAGADSIPAKELAQEKEADTIKHIELVLNDSVTLQYTEAGYKGFKHWFEDMASKKVMHPDKAWAQFISLEDYKEISLEFTSEVGRDGFYKLYAYFLQQINNAANKNKGRTELFAAYRDMNELKAYFQYGGTYFGHMHDRIYGYTEYSLYTFDKQLAGNGLSKNKQAFISMLKKVYSDKLNDDTNTAEEDKPERERKMMSIIDDTASQITNAYQLNEVKRFYEEYYDYWS